MGTGWQVVAFPVIVPWREEFWTLPLYFHNLVVGVVPGWPPELAVQGIPLPPEAQPLPQLKDYQPGELRQWQAFMEYSQAQEESNVLQAIRSYGRMPEASEQEATPEAWSLVWQLEKMQADQEAQLLLVDKGQEWLGEILAPEPWEDRVDFVPVPGVGEMVDPELARLRYVLWRRVMASHLKEPWAPLLLGRSSRSLFLTLRGWPQWTGLKKVQVSLPGCRSAAEWTAVRDAQGTAQWLKEFVERLTAVLTAATADFAGLEAAAQNLEELVAESVTPQWPSPPTWKWDLEIWTPEGKDAEIGPVLCWSGAGQGILPG
jgi:hypothetical protein